MSSHYDSTLDRLQASPQTWLVTGAAGFIGSNLVEHLLRYGQHVVGLDNFATGHRHNLLDVRQAVGEAAWERFHFLVGDITDPEICTAAMQGVDYVLHQAGLGSVPRSISDPLASHRANVDGFLHLLMAAQKAHVRRVVYASSSSVYGDHPGLPKREDTVGAPLSPYALTKSINEQYAALFARVYGIQAIGLRYFNVFGRRQDPNGPYAAVIPKWIAALLHDRPCVINGDGETSRDFCYVANVVQANILAATATSGGAVNEVYNVAVGDRTTLNQLYHMIVDALATHSSQHAALRALAPTYGPFRAGDVRHSLADITKARTLLGYQPTHSLADGLRETLGWYLEVAATAG